MTLRLIITLGSEVGLQTAQMTNMATCIQHLHEASYGPVPRKDTGPRNPLRSALIFLHAKRPGDSITLPEQNHLFLKNTINTPSSHQNVH